MRASTHTPNSVEAESTLRYLDSRRIHVFASVEMTLLQTGGEAGPVEIIKTNSQEFFFSSCLCADAVKDVILTVLHRMLNW